ncbi:winged helix-turn-helix domain-containing protein [Streptomyces hokutonensis]|uniref:winged helix-turn-helix domain-containing protein n=1 Tax=Streptomyces hokutonensis TaxID=1306990 RepID=UPI0033EF4F92
MDVGRSPAQHLEAAQRCERCVERGSLDVHVKRLRAKIEPDPGAPRYLVTVRGLGYKFEP